ncbi:MAG TPA: beta-ketoacyl synthase N-terminal-like domain-containing protein, partial [Casimicrobiaceae bacterium]|nr:beta-ketoacyl synthase N-terminal-like domain-containing protein [Casimicrobiaceae bacterium]
MPDAVIVSACRTAIGTAFKGTLTETTAFDLADAVVAESLARTGLGAADIDDVVLGETMYGGGVVARHTAVNLGLTDVPGLALNRHCASGLAAVATAAANIRAGLDDVVIAGGT